nr:DNA translocase FtsK [Desulfovirgula thermocuniculi]
MTLALLSLASLFTTAVGPVGELLFRAMLVTAGKGRYLLPVAILFYGLKLLLEGGFKWTSQHWGALVLLLTALTTLHLPISADEALRMGLAGEGGGVVGAAFSFVLQQSFGSVGSRIVLASLALAGFFFFTGRSPGRLLAIAWAGAKDAGRRIGRRVAGLLFEEVVEEEKKPHRQEERKARVKETRQAEATAGEQAKQPPLPVQVTRPPRTLADGRPYRLPPVTLLAKPRPRDDQVLEKEIAEKKQILEETLASFHIPARVVQVTVGPAITRYEIQPPAGVKVSRIVGLADDLALAMAAPDVRIEAPIPGKAAVGIEVPNREVATVGLRELLESREFTESPSPLTVALGRDIAGTPVVADLTQMPHLLIAGATGSGKSVCINTIIASILFKATPDEVKFLMIDPKMVELTTYNGIPHLVSPVVTSAKKAAGVLHWAVKEMERRYELFARAGVREIRRYNEVCRRAAEDTLAPLPYLVIIIDELADLMMVAPANVEDSICRLAQMARAAGIHLVVATQRPSVDVITGLIKANIPSRISFAVSSQMDSRTILDMGGAERLLGRGDMLFFPVGAPKPLRVQGAYLSEQEVERLTAFIREQAEPVYDQRVLEEPEVEEERESWEEEDELLPQAVRVLIESGCASISMLQRRLHIGYARAARLIDIMERRGIVGKHEGSKPRAILITMEQYQQMFGRTG